MVDISTKPTTDRVAIARGFVTMKPETAAMITNKEHKKGDVIGIAQTAGIMAAKKTSELIPLCHPLALSHVAIEVDVERTRAVITAECHVSAPTGVEMEALTAVMGAALTLYDMCKAADKTMTIEGVRLIEKSGGGSGRFKADD